MIRLIDSDKTPKLIGVNLIELKPRQNTEAIGFLDPSGQTVQYTAGRTHHVMGEQFAHELSTEGSSEWGDIRLKGDIKMTYQIVILCVCPDTCSNMAQSDNTKSASQKDSVKNSASPVIEKLDN
ncbi:hypothetical protein BTVI_11841 [Pitangus sulphuratus]|nr:hypothetical protein BTVI_11841 [Pitangus sulphuratus]